VQGAAVLGALLGDRVETLFAVISAGDSWQPGVRVGRVGLGDGLGMQGVRPASERVLQELKRTLGLDLLLLDYVLDQVLVALDQTFRVSLPVLQLLVPVSLDAFEQGGQGQLLLLLDPLFFFLQSSL